ncbi:chaperon for long tail fiber formation [Serratia phage vB_SspM_LC53]|nr:chaperon for long tail fiber formation [Serratia phage vB_SspM_LC53]
MSDVKKQVAQLESTVATLKVRVFDAQELAGQYKEQVESLSSLVQQIVQIAGVEAVDEQVTFDSILERIKGLALLEVREDDSEVEAEVEG